ncbi:alpha/beta fold hydrolase [Kineosporia succinea]|uniref:Pimeloyl-ACP methyl ester carboxylesterase n=1 Tax=Kineosporia succinea TaxID=84632 RepID=A0ABT9P4C3_9ACTN|nr:alpha/beta hydrolase [Kineosporia succinea]MDP9827327.1 pimeloyl-ACP methyl ester carboxylesterase [Kineosporia succinea]
MPVEQGEVQTVQLLDGPALAVARIEAPLRPFLLVHGESSDSSVWGQVAGRLVEAGHEIAAVDLRGHGRSESPGSGYDTDTCADDLSTLLDQLGYTGSRTPIVAGHGWGANVALSLAARRDGITGLCLIDGGWTRPAWRYPTFERFWTSAHPDTELGLPGHDPIVARRRSIAHSVFLGEPRALFPLVGVPTVLCPVVPPDGVADPDGGGTATRTGIAEALGGLPRARVSWYYGKGSRLLTSEPGRIADDLLMLAADSEPAVLG